MISAVLFLLLAGLCTWWGFTRHPIWAFYFYLASMYIFPSGRWWGYVFGGMRWALFSAAITALAIVFHRGKLQSKPPWIGTTPAIVMCLYATWMWIQTPWAQDLETHLSGSTQFTKYILAYWFVYRIADTKDRVRDVMMGHMAGCTLLGVLCMLEGRSDGRLDGVGGPGLDDANTLGMYLATGIIVGLGMLMSQTGWRRWASLVALVAMLEGLVLTNTRGAFLGLVGGWLVMAVFKARPHRRTFWLLALVGAIGLGAIVDKSFVERMYTIRESTVDSEDADQSARSRIVVARAQIEMFLDYPMGSGHRGTPALSSRYLEERWLTTAQGDGEAARASHNTFLTTLVEQGVPGALMFIWLSLWTLVAIVRLRRYELRHRDPQLTTYGASLVGALGVVFVAGNTADFLMAEVQFWMFALLATLLQFASRFATDPGAAMRAAVADPVRPAAVPGRPSSVEPVRPQTRSS